MVVVTRVISEVNVKEDGGEPRYLVEGREVG